MKSWLPFAFILAAAGLGACGGGSSSAIATNPTSPPCPQGAIAIQPPTLAYPAPAASNVPVNLGAIVFYMYGQPGVIPLDVQLTATVSNTSIDLGNITSAPGVIPTPTAAPPSPAPNAFGSVAVTTPLLHATQYAVTVSSPKGQCQLVGGGGSLGNFTTQ